MTDRPVARGKRAPGAEGRPARRVARPPAPAGVPPIDRRRSRSLASRRLLIDAAIRSIAERGLEATTLSSVSAIAGLSRGLVAFHFASKDALIEAAILDANGRYEESWAVHVRAPEFAPRDRLLAAIEHDIAFAERHPGLLSLWYAVWGEARGQAIYRELALPNDARYVDELAAMLAAAGRPAAAARHGGRLVNALLFGLWLEAHLDPMAFDPAAARASGRLLAKALLAG